MRGRNRWWILWLAAAVLVVIPRTAVYGAGLIAVVMVGAAACHLISGVGSPVASLVALSMAGFVVYARLRVAGRHARATDGGGLWVEDIFDVIVTGENDQPVVVSAIPDTTVMENSGDVANYRDLNTIFSDIEDGTALTYTAVSTNPTLISPVVDVTDSTLDLTLGVNENGTAQVTGPPPRPTT